jgi:hypothetical protein
LKFKQKEKVLSLKIAFKNCLEQRLWIHHAWKATVFFFFFFMPRQRTPHIMFFLQYFKSTRKTKIILATWTRKAHGFYVLIYWNTGYLNLDL